MLGPLNRSGTAGRRYTEGAQFPDQLDEGPIPRSLFLFHVDQHHCAIPVESVQEIVHIPAMAQLPGQPPILHGFLNLRGKAVPVLRLRRLLGLPVVEPELYAPVIIVRSEGNLLGFVATAVDSVLSVDDDDLTPVGPDASFNGITEAQLVLDGNPVAAISPERLLLTKEKIAVAELAQLAERRLHELENSRA